MTDEYEMEYTREDELLERITELEEENAKLKAYNEKLLNGDIEKHNKIVELQRENEELKKKYKSMCTIAHNRGSFVISAMRENRIFEEQLTKAKEIIKRLIKETYGEGWNYSLDVKVKAEDFLKEVE